MRSWYIAILSLLAVGIHAADLSVNPLFSNGMVLQRDAEVPVWGWATPGRKVIVTFGSAKVTAAVGDDGAWMVRLPKLSASSESRSLTIAAAGNEKPITITDVLVGEVWLCGGQSNMEVPVSALPNPQQLQQDAQFPLIRMATVGWATAREPVERPDPNRFLHDKRWHSATSEHALKMSAVGYFFGREMHRKLGIPIGLIACSKGGTPAETWMPRDVLLADPELAWTADPKLSHPDYTAPGLLYNGMIHPLLPYRIRGVIWYQGEDNLSRAWTYRKTLPALISSWRKQWGVTMPDEFPFGIVQLAGVGASLPFIGDDWWAELRESQAVVARQPGNGLAVALDTAIDDPDIHPNKRKDEVGKRLAFWALNTVYQRSDVAFSGPVYATHKNDGDKIRLTFNSTGGGLTFQGKSPSFFAVAGEDRQFKWATASIEGDTIVVRSDQVPKPVSVRYAWSNGPCLSDKTQIMNVYGKNGLPLVPFRTDSWKVASAPAVDFPAGVLPPAIVGKPYTAILTTANARGSAISYTVVPGTQVPTGLTLAPAGTLSGTLRSPGVFAIRIRATAESNASSDATLVLPIHAKGASPSWTVVYEANGANRGNAPIHQSFDGKAPLTLAGNDGTQALARTGFTFEGWSTLPDGSGETFAVGASYTKKMSQVLFAKWMPIQVEYHDQILPDAVIETAYQASAATGKCGDATLVYEKMSGKLANGLNFNFPFGTVSGTPTETGTFSIVVKCKTNTGQFREATVTMKVKAP